MIALTYSSAMLFRVDSSSTPTTMRPAKLDRCLSTGATCGTVVATAYCQARDFSQARSFRKVDNEEITGANAKSQACGIGCDELVAIECTR